jgi:hypothetical protein|tara:strand:+ start:188 stop:652 length:465 start_codon:yes stop_codon:yes gene_type:complete
MSEWILTYADGPHWHACPQWLWDQVGPDDDRVTFAHGFAYRVTLGRRFIDDHMGRDLPAGIVVGENQRTYTLLMTVDDIREVYSDADHYSSGAMDEWLEDDDTGYARSVIQAAGRVVAALRKQVPDQLRPTSRLESIEPVRGAGGQLIGFWAEE